jgi:hypothetical protein
LTHDIERFGIDAGFVDHGSGRLPAKRSRLAKIVFGPSRPERFRRYVHPNKSPYSIESHCLNRSPSSRRTTATR